MLAVTLNASNDCDASFDLSLLRRKNLICRFVVVVRLKWQSWIVNHLKFQPILFGQTSTAKFNVNSLWRRGNHMARHRNQRTTHRCWTCLVNVKEINFDEIAVESFRWFYRFMRFLRITKRNTRHIDITLSLISIMNGVLENTQKHFDSINRCSNTLCVVESSGANCQTKPQFSKSNAVT